MQLNMEHVFRPLCLFAAISIAFISGDIQAASQTTYQCHLHHLEWGDEILGDIIVTVEANDQKQAEAKAAHIDIWYNYAECHPV